MTPGNATQSVRESANEADPPKAMAEDLTFLVAGCQRCGTTWLYEALKEHPEICLPGSKQSHFFDEPAGKDLEWYLDRFHIVPAQHKAVGEVATGYSLPNAIPRMAVALPHVRIIMVMRNPVERAYSYYRSRAPHENWKSFEDALKTDPAIVSRGQYIDQIEALLKYYKRDDILFLLYDDLALDERKYLQQVYSFLGVDPSFEPNVIGNPVRAAMLPQLRRALRAAGLTPLVNLVNRSMLGDVIRRFLKSRRKSRKVQRTKPDHTHEQLQRHFHSYNERLSSFLQRDLTGWRT